MVTEEDRRLVGHILDDGKVKPPEAGKNFGLDFPGDKKDFNGFHIVELGNEPRLCLESALMDGFEVGDDLLDKGFFPGDAITPRRLGLAKIMGYCRSEKKN